MTERAVLNNINPLSKQDTNAAGVSVLGGGGGVGLGGGFNKNKDKR